MKNGVFLVGLVLLASAAIAEKTIRLRVSATIPPRSCEFPDRCDPVDTTPSAPSQVSVEKGVVRYIGTPPTVTEEDDLLIVNF